MLTIVAMVAVFAGITIMFTVIFPVFALMLPVLMVFFVIMAIMMIVVSVTNHWGMMISVVIIMMMTQIKADTNPDISRFGRVG